jgi:hypothetical protein
MRPSKRFSQNAWLSVTLVWSGVGCAQATAPTREWADAPDGPFVKQPADAPIPGPEEAETTDPLWQQIKEARRQDAEDSATRALDPQAEALLRRVAEQIARARTFTVDIHLLTTERHPRSNLTVETQHLLAVSRPGKLSFITRNAAFSTIIDGDCETTRAEIAFLDDGAHRITAHDMCLAKLICDGERLYLDIPYYAVDIAPEAAGAVGPAPKGRDVLGRLFDLYDIAPFSGHGSVANDLLEELLVDDPAAPGSSFMGSAHRLTDGGIEKVDGVDCHKLRYGLRVQGGYDLLVEDGATPVLRQVRPLRDPTETPDYVEQSTTFRNWKFDVALPGDQFAMPAARVGRASSPAASGTHP